MGKLQNRVRRTALYVRLGGGEVK
eukprot:SAG31_NODE_31947_length_362_cov_0.650190_1_plen_23_part_01